MNCHEQAFLLMEKKKNKCWKCIAADQYNWIL